MKLHIYRKTNHGLKRVNDQPLTADEAREIIKANPSYMMRNADAEDYYKTNGLLLQADWKDEPPTERELAIAKNFSVGLWIALASAVVLFIIQTLLP